MHDTARLQQTLYILPSDDRGSLQKKMFGWDGPLSAEQTSEIAGAKRVIGRTGFWDPLVNWRANKITRDAGVKEISRRYQEFVEVFELRHKAVHA